MRILVQCWHAEAHGGDRPYDWRDIWSLIRHADQCDTLLGGGNHISLEDPKAQCAIRFARQPLRKLTRIKIDHIEDLRPSLKPCRIQAA